MTASTDGPTVLPHERDRCVTVRVPAKINLDLKIGPLRPDGFHDLATVFHAVDLLDHVTVRPAADWACSVAGFDADVVPTDDSNLALRAARLLANSYPDLTGPVHVHIDKQIPVAGGMAGGSADAAGALLACDVLWGLDLGVEGLHAYAAELGSDVNFALVGGTAVGTGRGEQVVSALTSGEYHWVVVTADGGLSTPEVFRAIDRIRADRAGESDAPEAPDPAPSPALLTALRSGDAEGVAAHLSNDLQEAAFSLRPDLPSVHEAGLMLGALGGLVSGSGPTIVFLAADAHSAADLGAALVNSGAATRVHTATGPVPGAHVVGWEDRR